ncbi:MAG: thiamine phosphate synthase [Pyrinomonadaceae bacterium]
MEKLFKTDSLIYLITEGAATVENFSAASVEILKIIRAAVEAKINFVQIREKKLPSKSVFELAEKAVKLAKNTPTKILINDRADIARAAHADGVQLTSKSLPTEIIRQNFPKNFIIGVSTHNLAEAESAKTQGADFITFSPIFKTPSKEIYGAPQSLETLREVCEKLKPFPVIALGGIDETNFKKILENGAGGFAAIRFLNNLVKHQNAREMPEILEKFGNES